MVEDNINLPVLAMYIPWSPLQNENVGLWFKMITFFDKYIGPWGGDEVLQIMMLSATV